VRGPRLGGPAGIRLRRAIARAGRATRTNLFCLSCKHLYRRDCVILRRRSPWRERMWVTTSQTGETRIFDVPTLHGIPATAATERFEAVAPNTPAPCAPVSRHRRGQSRGRRASRKQTSQINGKRAQGVYEAPDQERMMIYSIRSAERVLSRTPDVSNRILCLPQSPWPAYKPDTPRHSSGRDKVVPAAHGR
jgi:hypothetical protein